MKLIVILSYWDMEVLYLCIPTKQEVHETYVSSKRYSYNTLRISSFGTQNGKVRRRVFLSRAYSFKYLNP